MNWRTSSGLLIDRLVSFLRRAPHGYLIRRAQCWRVAAGDVLVAAPADVIGPHVAIPPSGIPTAAWIRFPSLLAVVGIGWRVEGPFQDGEVTVQADRLIRGCDRDEFPPIAPEVLNDIGEDLRAARPKMSSSGAETFAREL